MTLKGGDIVPLELSGGDHEAHVMIGAAKLRVLSHRCSIAPLLPRRQMRNVTAPEEKPNGRDVLHDLIALMDAVEYDDIVKTRGKPDTVGLLATLLERNARWDK